MDTDNRDNEDFSHFKKAYNRTLNAEGFYSNDPFDPGGETFLGISRYWHPSWPGWVLIDKYGARHIPAFNLAALYRFAEDFYRVNFWDRIRGEKLADISPNIAEKIFDTAVNLSVTDSIRFLQDAINLLNRNAELYQDIMVDGRIGKITVGILEKYLITRPGSPKQNETRLLNVFRFIQGHHYINEMRKYPEKESFRGWFDRAAS